MGYFPYFRAASGNGGTGADAKSPEYPTGGILDLFRFGKEAPVGAAQRLQDLLAAEKLPKKVSKRVVRKGGNYAIVI